MTDFPPPSGRSESAKSWLFALFRPVLFAIGAIGAGPGRPGAALHRSASRRSPPFPAPPPADRHVADPPPIVLADARTGAADLSRGRLQGLPGIRARPARPRSRAEPEPPASDRYELTLRLEKGDTIEKMLADIDVPEADRKQIDQTLQAILKKTTLAAGEEIELLMQTMPDQPDAPRVLSLSVRPQPEREYIVKRQDDGRYDRRREDLQGEPAHRARRGRAQRLAASRAACARARRRPR